MAWRVAKSLDKLLDQINKMAPNRSKESDGSIGDAAHASRSSDHNPWVKQGSLGIVTARDITHDPKNGVDCNVLSEKVKEDRRVKYVIWNYRIWAPSVSKSWRKYTGSNPHNHHMHVSVSSDRALYDDASEWNVSATAVTKPPIMTQIKDLLGMSPKPPRPTIRQGSEGADVVFLQEKLELPNDGDFGPKTSAAVKALQALNKITADGIVGPQTWAIVEKLTAKKAATVPASVFDKVMPWVFEDEGGLTISSHEPGGASNMGVSLTAYSEYVGHKANIAELKELTKEDVKKFYYDRYWSKINADKLHPAVAYAAFDYAINAGISAANSSLGKALKETSTQDQIRTIRADRLERWMKSPHWNTYQRGWMNRLNRVDERLKEFL